MRARRSWICVALASICSWLTYSEAKAGPPFRTDDPEPVAYGHFEFFTFSEGLRGEDHASGALPGAELNYGLIPNGQLSIGGEVAFSAPGESGSHYGSGDTNLSFKYRFIDESPLSPQVSIYPEIDFPTGNRSRDLGAGHVRIFLPVWLQKSVGKWTTYGGGGYSIYEDENLGDKDYWFFGWLLQRKITDDLTLGGEIFHQTADNVLGKGETGFNLGGTYDIDEHNHLNLSRARIPDLAMRLVFRMGDNLLGCLGQEHGRLLLARICRRFPLPVASALGSRVDAGHLNCRRRLRQIRRFHPVVTRPLLSILGG